MYHNSLLLLVEFTFQSFLPIRTRKPCQMKRSAFSQFAHFIKHLNAGGVKDSLLVMVHVTVQKGNTNMRLICRKRQDAVVQARTPKNTTKNIGTNNCRPYQLQLSRRFHGFWSYRIASINLINKCTAERTTMDNIYSGCAYKILQTGLHAFAGHRPRFFFHGRSGKTVVRLCSLCLNICIILYCNGQLYCKEL